MSEHKHHVRIRVQALQLYSEGAGPTDALSYNAFEYAPLAQSALVPFNFRIRVD